MLTFGPHGTIVPPEFKGITIVLNKAETSTSVVPACVTAGANVVVVPAIVVDLMIVLLFHLMIVLLYLLVMLIVLMLLLLSLLLLLD